MYLDNVLYNIHTYNIEIRMNLMNTLFHLTDFFWKRSVQLKNKRPAMVIVQMRVKTIGTVIYTHSWTHVKEINEML